MNSFWTNWPVLAAVVLLSMVGAWCIYVDNPGAGIKQCEYLGVAVVCLFAFQAVNYKIIGRWAWAFYLFSLGLVLYTDAGHIHPLPGAYPIKGVIAWINFGPMSLEPSELVKIAFVLTLAWYLRYRSNYRSVGGLVKPFLLAIVPIVLILKQPDLGIAALFMPTLLAMLFAAGAKVKHIAAVVGSGLVLLPIFYFSGHRYVGKSDVRDPAREVAILKYLPTIMHEYQRDRIIGMFKPTAESAWQQEHALMAIGSGGWFGKGPGHIPVGRSVPEAHNDMIFALVGEQFGLLGALVVVVAFVVLFVMGLVIASNTKEPFGRLIAVGITAILACQATINLSVCLKMMPVTGVTLPFVSYGGSSLIASFMAAGLLMNVGQNRPITFAKEAFEFDDEE